jgi:hypothetical protein
MSHTVNYNEIIPDSEKFMKSDTKDSEINQIIIVNLVL